MIAQFNLDPGKLYQSSGMTGAFTTLFRESLKGSAEPRPPEKQEVFQSQHSFPIDYVTPQILSCLNPAVWLSDVSNPGSGQTVSGFLSEFCLQTVTTQTGNVPCPNGAPGH